MARRVELIYCAAGNPRCCALALAAGYQYGACLPGSVYAPLYFADQDYDSPDPQYRAKYMAALARYRPPLATVRDWEAQVPLTEVLAWAEEAAQYSQHILIVPKVPGGVRQIPRTIGGRPVILGYSVASGYGSTPVSLDEFAGWPVHLLGGSPQAQMAIWLRLRAQAEVVSADGNYAQKMAMAYCQFWVPGTAFYARNRWWPTLRESDGQRWTVNGPYEAFRRSCEHIREAWERMWANPTGACVHLGTVPVGGGVRQQTFI